MFRPSVIGPWPVFDLDSVQSFSFSGTAHTEDRIDPVFPYNSPRGDYDSLSFNFDTDYSLAAQSGISAGLAVSGEMDMPHHLIWSANASIHSLVAASHAQGALNIRAFLARSPTSGLRQAFDPAVDFSRSVLLPFQVHSSYAGKQEGVAQAADRQFTAFSSSGQTVLIAQGGASFGANPICLILSIFSAEAVSAVTLKNISVSMSLHKYAGDIETFSPTR